MKQVIDLFKKVIEQGRVNMVEESMLNFSFEIWCDGTFRALPFLDSSVLVLESAYDVAQQLNRLEDYGIETDLVALDSIENLLEYLKSTDCQYGFHLTQKVSPLVLEFKQFGCLDSPEVEELLATESKVRHPSLTVTFSKDIALMDIPYLIDSSLWTYIFLAHFSGVTKNWGKTNNYIVGELDFKFNKDIYVDDVEKAQRFLNLIPGMRYECVKINTTNFSELDVDKHIRKGEDFQELL